SAIASTLKSASLSDIEMRGFTFDQKRQTLHLQLRAANFASFDKLRSALATDYVAQRKRRGGFKRRKTDLRSLLF
ncbi:GspL/Epsl periplasmic domain-containing protein, partial [Escherichia sp. TWPC-MK]